MNKVVVIGGGTMGLGIAQVFAKKGIDTVVRDINDEIIARAEANLNKGMARWKIILYAVDALIVILCALLFAKFLKNYKKRTAEAKAAAKQEE